MTSVFSIPGGRTRIIPVAATAGNVVTSIVPSEAENRLHLIAARITLVCDATVANRIIRFYRVYSIVTGASTAMGPALNSATITASQTGSLGLESMINSLTGGTLDISTHCMNWQGYYVDKTGISGDATDMGFQIVISSGAAGDSYSGYVMLLERPC